MVRSKYKIVDMGDWVCVNSVEQAYQRIADCSQCRETQFEKKYGELYYTYMDWFALAIPIFYGLVWIGMDWFGLAWIGIMDWHRLV